MIFEQRPDWYRWARCKGYPAEIFYGFRSERPPALRRRLALVAELCGQCPVQKACRELGDREPYGIWGGATEAERGFGGNNWRSDRIPAEQARCAA